MKENVWAKTTLSVYRYIDRICGAIDKVVEKKAVASFYVYSSNFASSNVMNVADKIINLTERKKTLINLKVLICNALKNCQKLNAQLLIERYIENDKSSDIAQRHNLAMRSYFRKLAGAEKEFLYQMALMGYNENQLANFLAGEKWILEVYSQYSSMSREECFKLNEARINKQLALS